MSYVATKHPVSNRGVCPDSFLDQLVEFGRNAPDEIFPPNAKPDIYGAVANVLGPWQGLLHRKAAMLEVLRVAAAEESSWNWQEGVDSTNPASMSHPEQAETGAFQVSYDSLGFDPSLRACVVKYTGSDHLNVFLQEMKAQPQLACEYCARLFRFSIRWSGPAIHGVIAANVRRDCVSEFEGLLA